jgi:two-component system response regulator AlgR
MTPLKTLIVDDEPLAVERMQILCARLPALQLVGTASDGEAALRLIEALEPDLVFLDIAMPGLTGLDVANSLEGRTTLPAIVFVTAFDQFAVAAFDAAAVDYLLKPVAPERLEKAVQRVQERRRQADASRGAGRCACAALRAGILGPEPRRAHPSRCRRYRPDRGRA